MTALNESKILSATRLLQSYIEYLGHPTVLNGRLDLTRTMLEAIEKKLPGGHGSEYTQEECILRTPSSRIVKTSSGYYYCTSSTRKSMYTNKLRVTSKLLQCAQLFPISYTTPLLQRSFRRVHHIQSQCVYLEP
jgi:hypothetical protein